MEAANGEVAVFTDTNMDTHIALSVSPDIIVADFKRELARTHFSCFPKLGEIKVYEIMVRRRSCFYHLPESLPIKYAFQGLKGNRFLQVSVRPLNHLDNQGLSQCVAIKDNVRISGGSGSTITGALITNNEKNDMTPRSPGNDVNRTKGSIEPPAAELAKTIPCFKERWKKKKRLGAINKESPSRNKEAPNVSAQGCFVYPMPNDEVEPVIVSSPMVKIPSERSPEVITAKSDYRSIAQVHASLQFDVRTPPRTLTLPLSSASRPASSRNKLDRISAFGERVLTAARNLRFSADKQRPALSFYRCRSLPRGLSGVQRSIFEISDNDD